MKKAVLLITLMLVLASCGSITSSIKNVDNNAPEPVLKNGAFVITQYSKDKRYGYDKDYPINIYYRGTRDEFINQKYFLNALAGPNGEKITYIKLESCCPFPSKNTENGAGFLDVYEIKWEGQKKPIILYLDIYERGQLMVPLGLSLKKK